MKTAVVVLVLATCFTASAAELPKLPRYSERYTSFPGFTIWGGILVTESPTYERTPEQKKQLVTEIRGFYKKLDEGKQKGIAAAILERLDTEDRKLAALNALCDFVSYPDEVYEDCQTLLRILVENDNRVRNVIWGLEDDESCHEYCKLAKQIRPQLSRLEKLVKK